MERNVAALVAREFELKDPPWGATIVAILHGSIQATRSPEIGPDLVLALIGAVSRSRR